MKWLTKTVLLNAKAIYVTVSKEDNYKVNLHHHTLISDRVMLKFK